MTQEMKSPIMSLQTLTCFIKGAENTQMLHTQKKIETFGMTRHSKKISRAR